MKGGVGMANTAIIEYVIDGVYASALSMDISTLLQTLLRLSKIIVAECPLVHYLALPGALGADACAYQFLTNATVSIILGSLVLPWPSGMGGIFTSALKALLLNNKLCVMVNTDVVSNDTSTPAGS